MSLIINRTEEECPIRLFKSKKYRLYLEGGEWHDIYDVVIYDAKNGEVITRKKMHEFLVQSSIVIDSIGATTGVVKKNTPNLMKEEMFVHVYNEFTTIAKNPVTLYIPITYFTDYRFSVQARLGHLDTVSTSQRLKLFFEHAGNVHQLLIDEIDNLYIKEWYIADRKKWFEERRKLDSEAKKEILRMQKENVSHKELQTYLHEYHSKLYKRAKKEFERLGSGGEFFLGFLDNEPVTTEEEQ